MRPMDAVSALARTSLAGPDDKTAGELAQKKQNISEYNNATKAAPATPAEKATPSPKDAVNPTARYGARHGEQRIDTKDMTKPLGSFEKGTAHVPKTGVYKLHEGEAVIPKEKNMDNKVSAMMKDGLSDEKKPKKEIKEMVHRKSANGKHIVVHKHHHPEHHADEEHVMNDMSELHKHMEDHAGTPNEGEAAPADGSGPTPMTAAPSPMPAPAAGNPAGM